MTNLPFNITDKEATESMLSRDRSWRQACTVLENGLRVVSATLPHLHTSAVNVFAPGGPRYESASDNGLSHLVEHGIFRGCAAYPSARSFNEAVESCSLGLGAATYREFVSFDGLCVPERLQELLTLVGAMLASPTWADLDIEQRIIVEELQDELDEEGRDIDVDNIAKRALMPECGGGRKIGGDIARVKRFTLEDCQRWFGACYGATNLVLSVASPLTHEAVLGLAEATFGHLSKGAPITPTLLRTRADLPALEYVGHGGRQTSLQIAWLVPPPTSPEWTALKALQRLLDDGTCARLRRRVTDLDGLAYHVGSSLEAFSDRSLLVIEADTSHDHVLPLIDAVFEEIAALGHEPVPQHEWSRLRDRFDFDLSVVIDAPSEIAYRLGLAAFYGRDLDLDESRARFMALSPEAVSDAVRTYLRPEAAQISVVGTLDPLQRAGLRRRIHRMRASEDTSLSSSLSA